MSDWEQVSVNMLAEKIICSKMEPKRQRDGIRLRQIRFQEAPEEGRQVPYYRNAQRRNLRDGLDCDLHIFGRDVRVQGRVGSFNREAEPRFAEAPSRHSPAPA